MKPQKIILMYDFLHEVGGLEKLMTIHANYLKEEGYNVEIFFSDINKETLNKNPIFKNLKIKEYGYFSKGVSKIILGILGFNNLKKMIDPEDVIISYSFPVNLTIKNMKNRKICYLNHFPNFLYLPFNEKIIWANDFKRKLAFISSILLGPLLRKVDKQLVESSCLAFVNSEFTKKRLDKIYEINGIVSYPPVSKDIKPSLDKRILKKYSLIGKRFVFSSGRVIPDKKVDWLIEAFSKVKEKDLILLICGQIDSKEKIKLENLAKKVNVSDKVKFLGIIPREDLIKLYSLANVYAFSAQKEDFGLVPAEAISCGAPVVVWGDGSGPNEIIKNNINGLYAKPYLIEDFTKKLSEALNKKWDKTKIIQTSKKFSEKEIKTEFIRTIKKSIYFVAPK